MLTDDRFISNGLVNQLMFVVVLFQYENLGALLTRVPRFYNRQDTELIQACKHNSVHLELENFPYRFYDI